MDKKRESILKEALKKVRPPKEDLEFIDKNLKEFLKKVKIRIKSLDIKAEIFVGGSYSKKTMIKKDRYDIDIFLRFDKKYNNKEISGMTEEILKGVGNFIKVHGSRDYFQVNVSPLLFFEIVPVKKITKSEQAENITDLSYSHVKYINKKIKNEKILNEVMLAKAFCYAKNCYGAESYIRGFSGYGLELLICYYKSFLKFIKAIATSRKGEKIIIDIEKQHKNKKNILLDLNSSKLQSPIILIDPTYKQRNVLAALSQETFEKFKDQCKKFLENPSIRSFEVEKIDLEKIYSENKKNNYEIIILEVKTKLQEGDVAGSKLFKFYRHLAKEIEKYFEIKEKYFEYSKKKSARYIFVIKAKKEIVYVGPFIEDKINLNLFRHKHRNTFIRGGRIHAREKINFTIRKFLNLWKQDNKKKINDMGISKIIIK